MMLALAWVFIAVIIVGKGEPEVHTLSFADPDACTNARAAVVEKMKHSQRNDLDWANGEPVFGGVSECTRIEIRTIMRHA